MKNLNRDYKYLTFKNFEEKLDVDILFDLLSKRKFSISSIRMPTKNEHKKFCKTHPYLHWILIYKNGKAIGTFYITRFNNISINLIDNSHESYKIVLEFIINNFKPLPEKASEIPKFFCINLNPNNKFLKKAVKDLKGELIQHSYILKN